MEKWVGWNRWQDCPASVSKGFFPVYQLQQWHSVPLVGIPVTWKDMGGYHFLLVLPMSLPHLDTTAMKQQWRYTDMNLHQHPYYAH